MQKIAHKEDSREQSIYNHVINVAECAAEFCRDYRINGTNVSQYAYTVGLAHDIGKYSDLFQKKIRGNLAISVDHSTAGARELRTLRMIAGMFAVAGHHGGIPNGRDMTEQNLIERVGKRKLEPYDDYKDEITLEAVEEPKLSPLEQAFFIRMIFSALVDADFLDTEYFVKKGNVDRGNYESIEVLYEKLENYISPWRKSKEGVTELNRIRTAILEQCISRGQDERGLYSLTIPTGGGKTISSLAFALAHAKRNGMNRIIYVIPYTSIIEQNVQVFRDILGEKNVLAHYSNSLLASENEQKKYYEKHKLDIENWDAPVIVTTNVQFFESFYSNKVSKCRKLHNIANSVIIFDEVQMIPLNYLKPCVKVIQKLVESYSATAVLCTATQPALEKWMEPLKVKEIYDDYETVFQKLKRVRMEDIGTIEEDELIERIQNKNQILTIVNTKAEAQKLYQKIPQEGKFHLSTYMTPIDRKSTLETIRTRLKSGQVCRVISTSLVEAGVDVDFSSVMREKAGLDSMVQAAGRCNREGRRTVEESIVEVFRFTTIPKMIEKNAAIAEETFEKYKEYNSLEAIRYYFTALQNLDEKSLDQKRILEGFEKDYEGIMFPFKKIAEIFHLIDSDTRMLIIPDRKDAADLVEKLENKLKSGDSIRIVLQQLGEYSINVYEREYHSLIEDNSAYEVIDGIAVLQNLTMYSKEMGLQYKKGESNVWIF